MATKTATQTGRSRVTRTVTPTLTGTARLSSTAQRLKAEYGLDNNGRTITNLGTTGASLNRVGAHELILTTTALTNVTLPTSGALAGLSTAQTFTADQRVSGEFSVGQFGGDGTDGRFTVAGTNSEITILDKGETSYSRGANTYIQYAQFGYWNFYAGDQILRIQPSSASNHLMGLNTYPSAKFHVTGTTEQLRVGYDSSNYMSVTVSSAGLSTITSTGGISFSGGARINARVASAASPTNPTPDVATTDLYEVTAATGTLAFQVPTGTPTNGQKLMIRIYAAGTQTITWSSSTGGYVAGGTALPSATAAGKWMHLGFLYNSNYSGGARWMLVAALTEA